MSTYNNLYLDFSPKYHKPLTPDKTAQDRLLQALNKSTWKDQLRKENQLYVLSKRTTSSSTTRTPRTPRSTTAIKSTTSSNYTLPVVIGYYSKSDESENCRWCIDDKPDPVKENQEKLMDAIIKQGLRARNKNKRRRNGFKPYKKSVIRERGFLF